MPGTSEEARPIVGTMLQSSRPLPRAGNSKLKTKNSKLTRVHTLRRVPVYGAQCSPNARARKVAIWARVTTAVGRKVPSG